MEVITTGRETSPEPIRFRLASGRADVLADVRLRRAGDRWIAVSDSGGREVTAIGSTARAAIAASVDWLGPVTVRELLVDLQLLDVSVKLTDVSGG